MLPFANCKLLGKLDLLESISRKPIIKSFVDESLEAYKKEGFECLVDSLCNNILSKKVKFPLLEYAARLYYEGIEEEFHIIFCDLVEARKLEGGNVILGSLLQLRMEFHYENSISKAAEYISKAHIWYVCDIIGERVFGHALLHHYSNAIQDYKKLINNSNHWLLRSLGAGAHLAIKWNLEKEKVKEVFEILLLVANSKNKEIRQGIGWAAKTSLKFHPEIAIEFQTVLSDENKVANLFRKKVQIGLERNAYLKEK